MLKLMTTHRLLQLLEKNDSAAELSDTNTTANQVQLEFNPRQHQMSLSTKKNTTETPSIGKRVFMFSNLWKNCTDRPMFQTNSIDYKY